MSKEELNASKSYELENYSRRVRDYFSKMRKIKNDIKLNRESYNLSQENKQKILIKLDNLITLPKDDNRSIETYFNKEIQRFDSLVYQHRVFEKYYNLLKDCFGKSIYEFLEDIDIESKLNEANVFN